MVTIKFVQFQRSQIGACVVGVCLLYEWKSSCEGGRRSTNSKEENVWRRLEKYELPSSSETSERVLCSIHLKLFSPTNSPVLPLSRELHLTRTLFLHSFFLVVSFPHALTSFHPFRYKFTHIQTTTFFSTFSSSLTLSLSPSSDRIDPKDFHLHLRFQGSSQSHVLLYTSSPMVCIHPSFSLASLLPSV